MNDRVLRLESACHELSARRIRRWARCECGRTDCEQTIAIGEEACRALPTRFLVVPGHEIAGVDRIVEVHEHYGVAAVYGRAAASVTN